MYTIYVDNELLYSPRFTEDGYSVINPKMTLELNKAGSLTFLLPPNNPCYDRIHKLKSVITVIQDGEEVFRGRVLHDEKDYYNRKDIYCEGELSFLLDSVQRPYTFTGDIPDLFEQFLNNHNSQVDDWKQFRIGEITVTDPNNYINRQNSDYSLTLDALIEKLVDTHGGYIRTRLSNGGRYLDYVQDYGHINSQVIQFGVNMLDISEYISADEVFTVLIPLGVEQLDDDGNLIGRLTIESVNGGKDFIADEDAIALFGTICRIEKWDDVTLPENLFKKGQEFLKNGVQMAVSLNMKAVDMHLVDVDTERIKLGDFIRVVSVPHNLDKDFLCSKIDVDIMNPEQTEFTLGVTFKALTEHQVNSSKTVNNIVSVAQTAKDSAQESMKQSTETDKKVDDTIIMVREEYVSKNTFAKYQEEVNFKISAVYHVKGSVANFDSLPKTNNSIGDVYNLSDTGANYVWTESGWDKLSETVDLSGYATKEEVTEAVGNIDLSPYAKKTDIPKKVSAFENDAGYLTQHQSLTDYAKKTDLSNHTGDTNNPHKVTAKQVGTYTSTELDAKFGKKVNDFQIEIYNGTAGNPKPVKFMTVNYSTCNSEAGVLAKISMVSGHGNAISYAFLQDVIFKITHTGAVEVNNFKYYGAEVSYAERNMQYGDIFYIIDTTNKIVDFYCLMGQYARLNMTPYKRLTYSTGGVITQYTTATIYSTGTRVFANNAKLALLTDIPSLTDYAKKTDLGNYLPITGGTLTGALTVAGGASINNLGYVVGTWLRSTTDNHLPSTPAQVCVQSNGWVYYRTLDELKKDIGIKSTETWTFVLEDGTTTTKNILLN